MSSAPPIDLPTAIPCHRCGYDVRAQSADGRCPECGAAVAESRRLAAIPRRPVWRDSDPRWRRRMLAGVWVLVLVPVMAVLRSLQWSTLIPVPTFYDVQCGQVLDDSYITYVYAYLTFCIGMVLLFSKERNRQPSRLDWTRRWGVINSYGVLVLGIPTYAFITALVVVGIAALCLSMPLRHQPAMTLWFVKAGTGYIHYGPYPGRLADAALIAFSSIVVLLACVPLFNALRSSGPKVLAAMLLAPLALTSVVLVAYAVLYALNLYPSSPRWLEERCFYFDPEPLAKAVADLSGSSLDRDVMAEAAKWFACLGIAIWLTIAQIAAICRCTRSSSYGGLQPAK
jgi:hypothetical protein